MRKEKWTKESVKEEAKKYKVKEHFARKSSGAYKFAVRHNLIASYDWFETKNKPIGYWTKEKCEEESRKYKSRSEYKKGASGSYEAARVNNWIDNYFWLDNKNVVKERVDSIYGYFFDDETVYIGRTINPQNRDKDHRKLEKKDTVFRYAEEHGVPIPEMIIIENQITISEGKKREQFWIDYYKDKGYNVINKARGGGIGNLTFGKYTKDEIVKEASKYTSRKDFMKKSPNFYYHAWKSGILKEVIPSVQAFKRGFWRDRKNVEEKSKEYSTLKEFSKNSKGAYDAAIKGGYLKELTWLKRQRKRK